MILPHLIVLSAIFATASAEFHEVAWKKLHAMGKGKSFDRVNVDRHSTGFAGDADSDAGSTSLDSDGNTTLVDGALHSEIGEINSKEVISLKAGPIVKVFLEIFG